LLKRVEGGLLFSIERHPPMAYYPVFINIRGKKCVVVGGGKVAFRKIKALLECGAEVTVVSPSINPELNDLIKKRRIDHISREYEPEDLKDTFMIIAATDSAETNLKIALGARNQRILVNIANNLDQSDFIIPSSFRRGDLTIAVSTAGMSPALTKKIRTRL
jgi:siroheme synthase-like protein